MLGCRRVAGGVVFFFWQAWFDLGRVRYDRYVVEIGVKYIMVRL